MALNECKHAHGQGDLWAVLGLCSSHGFSGILKAETAAAPLTHILTLCYVFDLVISTLDF